MEQKQEVGEISALVHLNFTPEENARAWVGAIASLLAALSILFGVVKYAIDKHRKASVEEVGETMLDEQRMNYFVVDIPSRWWALVFWRRKTVKPPLLPTLSFIFRAGDHNLYSSSMFDWIHIPTGSSAVGWKSLLEAFFDELAWKSVKHSKLASPATSKALRAAEKHIETLKSESSRQEPNTWDRHLLYGKAKISILNEYKTYLDAVPDAENGDLRVRKDQKQLENCILDLQVACGWPEGKLCRYILGPHNIWGSDCRELWIQNGIPCLQVSREELAALSFAVGMPLKLHTPQNITEKPRLTGAGAFGISVFGEPMKSSELWLLRIFYERRDRHKEASKGNGYSMIFALRMACKCLPFGRSDGYIHAVEVTNELCNALKLGSSIQDAVHHDERWRSYCDRLPSAVPTYYYRQKHDEANEFGNIYMKEHRVVGCWHKAVAGIAFGGLVPFAAADLVAAVRFTAEGGRDTNIDNFLKYMSQLVLEVQAREKKYRLFGSFVEARSRVALDAWVLLSDQLPCSFDLSFATTILGRYATMLEYLTAAAFDGKEDPAKKVYQACCDEFESAYKAAVRKERGEFVHVGGRSPDEDLKEFTINYNRAGRCSIADCARIARYIVLAWTFHVGLVVWDEPDGPQSEKNTAESLLGCKHANPQNHFKRRIYNPIVIDNLPRSSILY